MRLGFGTTILGPVFQLANYCPETVQAQQSPPNFAGLHRPKEKLSVMKFTNGPSQKA